MSANRSMECLRYMPDPRLETVGNHLRSSIPGLRDDCFADLLAAVDTAVRGQAEPAGTDASAISRA